MHNECAIKAGDLNPVTTNKILHLRWFTSASFEGGRTVLAGDSFSNAEVATFKTNVIASRVARHHNVAVSIEGAVGSRLDILTERRIKAQNEMTAAVNCFRTASPVDGSYDGTQMMTKIRIAKAAQKAEVKALEDRLDAAVRSGLDDIIGRDEYEDLLRSRHLLKTDE